MKKQNLGELFRGPILEAPYVTQTAQNISPRAKNKTESASPTRHHSDPFSIIFCSIFIPL